MNIEKESLPFQQIHPIKAMYEEASDKKLFFETLRKGGIEIQGKIITPFDFFSTPNNFFNEKEGEEAVEAFLGIDDIDKEIEKISKAWNASKEYMTGWLGVNLPKEIKKINKIKSNKDIINIFNKTATIGKKDSLTLSHIYCPMMITTAAFLEYNKEGLKELISESKYLYQQLFRNNGLYKYELGRAEAEEYDNVGVMTRDDQWINAQSSFRGKEEESAVSKFIFKPETSLRDILGDGIGLKFEVKNKNEAKNIIIFFSEYFKKNFDAKGLTFESVRLFSEKDLKEIRSRGLMFEDDDNSSSSENFQAARLNGKVRVLSGGGEGAIKKERPFETQIVLTNNKNESGFSNHNIYKAVQKVAVFTRLFGSITEEYLDLYCGEASEKSKIAPNKIKDYIKRNFLTEVRYLKQKKPKYVTTKHLERWLMPWKGKAAIFPEKKVFRRELE